MKRLLSAGDVASTLGVSYERVRQLRLCGKLRAVRVKAGWLYRHDDVMRYAEQREKWLRTRGRRA